MWYWVRYAVVLSLGGILATPAAWGVSPAEKCQARKLKTAGKYAFCRAQADAKAIKTASTPDYSKCDEKFGFKWGQAETSAGIGVCPSEGDQSALQSFITQHTDDVATALAGGPLPDCPAALAAALICGNSAIDAGELCDQGNLNGQTCITQGFVGGTLACGSGCVFDTSGCSTARFVDNGDGTVTDTQTRLVWEKKQNLDGNVNPADPHDADNTYAWSTGTDTPDGSAFVDFIYVLNGTSATGVSMDGCFASHCDWRLPTATELLTSGILDQSFGSCSGGSGPCIDPVFGPTPAAEYWSGTTFWNVGDPPRTSAWASDFGSGAGTNELKTTNLNVRAVRGGA